MKKEIYDIREMSDSKEIYGRRPNPFIPGFIYSLVGLLIIALIYSFIGKIEVVATANGLVRPNDDVSTVAAEVGGRIKEVNISEGKQVEKGDVLYSFDMSEGQTSLNVLKEESDKIKKEIEFRERFLKGIESGVNPFSSEKTAEKLSHPASCCPDPTPDIQCPSASDPRVWPYRLPAPGPGPPGCLPSAQVQSLRFLPG